PNHSYRLTWGAYPLSQRHHTKRQDGNHNVPVNTMKVHLLRLVERGLIGKDGSGKYLHRITTPENAERVTPVPGAEERHTPSTVTLEPVHGENTSENGTDVMEDDTPEDERMDIRVTPVKLDTPPVTNGHQNGHANGTAAIEPPPSSFCPGCGA